jgi:dTDP-glucose 4,6-dehydratase
MGLEAAPDPPMARHALVTGGRGFLGTWLCRTLAAAGWSVESLDVCSGRAGNSPLVLAGTVISRLVDITQDFEVCARPDVVFHLASIASPPRYQQRPIDTLLVGSEGTRRALDVARRHGARFLLASSSEVYGDPLEHPQREDDWGHVNPIGPRSMYDESKRFSEALTSAYRSESGVDTGIVRIFNTYGPGMSSDDGRMIPEFIQAALAGRPLPVTGDGSQTRSLCYVEDTISALLQMADSGHSGPINIGNPEERTVASIACDVNAATGNDAGIAWVDKREDDPRRRCPVVQRAALVLGWAPSVSWADGLDRTIEWFARA